MSSGKVVQVIGAVVDVEFPRDALPKIFDAIIADSAGLTMEVQQQLGDGVVRAIAMGTTDGLQRGVEVSNTGAPRSEEHTSELQSHSEIVCRLLLEKKNEKFANDTSSR